MDNRMLQQWVEDISLTAFERPFLHQATFNSRLSSTGGRYFMKSHNIEISSRHYESHGRDEIERIIKHELCHYHLHLLQRGYKHGDMEFKQLLEKVGGSRYCSALPGRTDRRTLPYRYRMICTHCAMTYLRKRKPDVRKYVCGVCRGKLALQVLKEPALTGTGKPT